MHVCICYGYTLLHVYICKLHALSMEGWGGVWGEMGRDCLLNQGRGLQDIVLGPRICPCGLNNWSIFIGYPVYMNVHCSCRNDGKDLIVYWSKAGGLHMLAHADATFPHLCPFSNFKCRRTTQLHNLTHFVCSYVKYVNAHSPAHSYVFICSW